ncbi:MAG TPA: hypothetical protein VML75_10755 [Kofleriaceae bacterium]|nr:hypothetical protein [Kofleriaceae bacterium]
MRCFALVLVPVVALACLATVPREACADTDYFGEDAPTQDISFRTDIPRTRNQRIVIASLFGGAALFGAVGVGFHLDSRSKSDAVSALGDHTRVTWDDSHESTRSSALRSRTLAIVGYSAGGVLLVAGTIALYLTEPGTNVVTVGDEAETAPSPVVPVSLVPVRGGAVVGGTWSF